MIFAEGSRSGADMAPRIMLRLHPIEPILRDAFPTCLNGLAIEVFDLGITDLPAGKSLGIAKRS